MPLAPLLRTRVVGVGIRLELGTWSYGNGRSLVEASDDLVARLLRSAAAIRTTGVMLAPEAPAPDREFLDFFWELGELADRGEDVRDRIFSPHKPG